MNETKDLRRWIVLLSVWLLVTIPLAGLLTTPRVQSRFLTLASFLISTDLKIRDSLIRSLPPLVADSDIIFLGIDDSSMMIGEDDPAVIEKSRALTLMSEPWPWSRELWGLAIDRLLESGAKLVILDLLITTPRAGDEVLEAVIAKYPGQVVLASDLTPPAFSQGSAGIGRHLEPSESIIPGNLDDSTVPVGFVNFWPQIDGQVRQVRFRETIEAVANIPDHPSSTVYSSMAAETLTALGEPYPVLSQRGSYTMQMVSNLAAVYPPKPLYEIFWPSMWRQNFANGDLFRDKIVMIGPAATGLQDRHSTPAGTVLGPQLHLNAITAVRNNALFEAVSPRVDAMAIVLAGLLSTLVVGIFRRPLLAFGILGLLFFAAILGARAALSSGHSFGVIGPLMGILTIGGAGVIYDYSRVFRERLLLRRALERRVSAAVLNEIMDNPSSYLNQLGGVRKTVTILFSDLRGFTKMSENAVPEEMVARLNTYFDVMVRRIQENRGMVDKFIGDAIMAVWGSVPSQPPEDSVRQAVNSGLRMGQELEKLNLRWADLAKREDLPPIQWAMGIGLHCGDAITGNIGSERRLELTVIGDAVNLASRLEGVTKPYGVPIIVSETVASFLPEKDGWIVRPLDRVRVMGRNAPVTLYQPLSSPEMAEETKAIPLVNAAAEYAAAFDAYQAQDFEEAHRAYKALVARFPEDVSTRKLEERCREFLRYPPSQPWDGGITLDSK